MRIMLPKGKLILFNRASKAHWFSYHWPLDVKQKVTLTCLFRGNLLLPHRLLFPISSERSFIHTFPQTRQRIPQPLTDQLWTIGYYHASNKAAIFCRIVCWESLKQSRFALWTCHTVQKCVSVCRRIWHSTNMSLYADIHYRYARHTSYMVRVHSQTALNMTSKKRFCARSKRLAYRNVPDICWAYVVICYMYVGHMSGVSLLYVASDAQKKHPYGKQMNNVVLCMSNTWLPYSQHVLTYFKV